MRGFKGRIARFALAICLLAGLLLGRLFLSGGRRAQAVAPTPIALVVDPGAPNSLGLYLGEILRAEGWVVYDVLSLSSISPSLLQPYPVVLLAEVPLSRSRSGSAWILISPGSLLWRSRHAPPRWRSTPIRIPNNLPSRS